MPPIGCRRHKLFYGKCVILRKGTKLFGTIEKATTKKVRNINNLKKMSVKALFYEKMIIFATSSRIFTKIIIVSVWRML